MIASDRPGAGLWERRGRSILPARFFAASARRDPEAQETAERRKRREEEKVEGVGARIESVLQRVAGKLAEGRASRQPRNQDEREREAEDGAGHRSRALEPPRRDAARVRASLSQSGLVYGWRGGSVRDSAGAVVR